jgi:hypothetical protein
MNIDKGWLIICAVLTLVLLFNVGLALSFLRGKTDVLQNMLRGLKNPWREEDEALADLRARVENFTQEDQVGEPPHEA